MSRSRRTLKGLQVGKIIHSPTQQVTTEKRLTSFNCKTTWTAARVASQFVWVVKENQRATLLRYVVKKIVLWGATAYSRTQSSTQSKHWILNISCEYESDKSLIHIWYFKYLHIPTNACGIIFEQQPNMLSDVKEVETKLNHWLHECANICADRLLTSSPLATNAPFETKCDWRSC